MACSSEKLCALEEQVLILHLQKGKHIEAPLEKISWMGGKGLEKQAWWLGTYEMRHPQDVPLGGGYCTWGTLRMCWVWGVELHTVVCFIPVFISIADDICLQTPCSVGWTVQVFLAVNSAQLTPGQWRWGSSTVRMYFLHASGCCRHSVSWECRSGVLFPGFPLLNKSVIFSLPLP